jgi:predicted patatin/cPLA2 family phospholipase
MTGIRGASAMISFQELGLSNAFDSIYCASAGFLNASYMLSGNPRVGTSIYYEELSGSKFLNFFRIWNIVNIDYLINIFRKEKQINIDNIWKSNTKVYVRIFNRKKHRPKYIEIHNYRQEDFFQIAKASIAIPYLHPEAIKIGKIYCKDGEFSHADNIQEIDYALASNATDILVIYNKPEQKLVNIGLREILDVGHWDRVCEIYPDKEWKLSRFERNTEKLKYACRQMGNKIMSEFGGRDFNI